MLKAISNSWNWVTKINFNKLFIEFSRYAINSIDWFNVNT